jgi:enamine deaminase RidA (YjgF/YER057c/UK114 family)
MSIENRLRELGITLPAPPKPVGSYIPAVRTANLVFLSGTLPFQEGKLAWEGKLGHELTVEQGKQAARLALINALAVIQQALGSLDRVKRIVRLGGHVASAPGFNQQPMVLNGASDLLVEIFGERGIHARLALGAIELPLNASVELELIVEVEGE